MKKNSLSIILLLVLLVAIFTIPFLDMGFVRSASVFDLNKSEVSLESFNRIKEDFAFVYFGYMGCGDVCPFSLQNMDKLQKELKKAPERKKIGFYFINLSRGLKTDDVQTYVDLYNQSAKAIVPTSGDFEVIEDQFSSLETASIGVKNPFEHADILFQLKRISPNSDKWIIVSTVRNFSHSKLNLNQEFASQLNQNFSE